MPSTVTETTLQEIIDQAWASANSAMNNAFTYSDQAITWAGSFIGLADPHIPTEPDDVAAVLPPNYDWDTLFDTVYNNSLAELKPFLEDNLDEWLDKYFPNYAVRLENLSAYLDDVIQNGGTGLPPAVEAAIYARGLDRTAQQNLRAEMEAADFYAARGFPLPTGMLERQLDEIRQQSNNSLNEINRDIIINQAELEQKNIHHAITQNVDLLTGVIRSALDYMNAIAAMVNASTAKATALIEAIMNMYRAIAAYNDAVVAAEELGLKYDELYINRDINHAQNAINAFKVTADNRVQAALGSAQAMGHMAAAALSSQNTMATLAHETIAED